MTTGTFAGGTAVAVALVLLALNLAGVMCGTPEHPIAAVQSKHKNGIDSLTYQRSLDALASIEDQYPAGDRLSKITSVFAARLRYYWPAADKTDVDAMFAWHENWYLAARQRLEAALARQGMANVDIARLERRDYRSILQKGVGLCSQESLAIADYLAEQGRPAFIVALGGHVVALTTLAQQNYVLDPAYNVTFAVPATKPSTWAEIARGAYTGAGYSGKRLERVVDVYRKTTADGPLEVSRYTGGPRRTLRLAEVIKWAMPLVLLMLGGWLMVRAQRRP